jgi:DNA topoisomerase-1
MNLMIVDSPAIARQLSEVLDKDWRVEPCPMSLCRLNILHGEFMREMPETIGLDIPRASQNTARRLLKVAVDADIIALATAPDRAGEVKAWALMRLLESLGKEIIHRIDPVQFNRESMEAALEVHRLLNGQWVLAELTRQVAERMIETAVRGAMIPSFERLPFPTFAELRTLILLAERETQSAVGKPAAWSFTAAMRAKDQALQAELFHPDGRLLTISNHAKALGLVELLKSGVFWVEKSGVRTVERAPSPSYTLASLLLEAERLLQLTPERTLFLLQTLYKGGWISCPTSVSVPLAALTDAVKAHIRREFGEAYLSIQPVVNGIHTTYIHLSSPTAAGDGARLYELIWRRFCEAHMAPAQVEQWRARIQVGRVYGQPAPLVFRAEREITIFDGWQRLSANASSATNQPLPAVNEGETIICEGIELQLCPADQSESLTTASLIAQHGIAEPKSWANALKHLKKLDYVSEENGVLLLTDDGRRFTDWLQNDFGTILNSEFTQAHNERIERIASGSETGKDMLNDLFEDIDALIDYPGPEANEHQPILLQPIPVGGNS